MIRTINSITKIKLYYVLFETYQKKYIQKKLSSRIVYLNLILYKMDVFYVNQFGWIHKTITFKSVVNKNFNLFCLNL